MNGDAKVAEKTVTAEDGWKWSFAGLPKYKNGEEIVYTITEDPVEGYSAAVNGYDITNSHTPETIDISGSKTWDDKDDQDGKRPDSVTIRLMNGDAKVAEKTVTDKDGWKWSFVNLPKYENGKEIIYTIKEDAVEGYTAEIDGYNVTNSHEPETFETKISTVWEDGNNNDGSRPESTNIHLNKNGENFVSKEVTKDQNWMLIVKNLPKYEKGKEIAYEVTQDPIKNYTTTITGNAADGFVITNSYVAPPTAKPTSEPTAKPTNPPVPSYPVLNVPIEARKTVKNGTLKAEQFTFILKDGRGKEIARTTNKADGSIAFKDRTFSREVENYTYTIEEVIGKEKALSYDKTVYTLKVSTRGVDGKLQARIDIEKDGIPYDGEIVFTNTYNIPKTGDSTYQIIGLLLVVSAALAGGAYALGRKRKNNA